MSRPCNPLPGWTRRQTLGAFGAFGGLVTAPVLASTALPTARAVPGGVDVVPLGASPQRPVARLDGQRVLVLGDAAGWQAVVGLALSLEPGRLSLHVGWADRGPSSHAITVEAARYAEQRLKVPPRQVDLSARDLARHQREREHLKRVMATHSERLPAGLRMRAPVPGPRSGSFGLRRFFNGQARAPHNGMDIAAPTGTPVRCPLPGRVIDVGDYFFAGRCVWLDHGSGMLSWYAHLDTIDTRVDRELVVGDALGSVGATGRVTGPHLHWSVMLNRAYVDPALFLDA